MDLEHVTLHETKKNHMNVNKTWTVTSHSCWEMRLWFQKQIMSARRVCVQSVSWAWGESHSISWQDVHTDQQTQTPLIEGFLETNRFAIQQLSAARRGCFNKNEPSVIAGTLWQLKDSIDPSLSSAPWLQLLGLMNFTEQNWRFLWSALCRYYSYMEWREL